MSETWKGKTRGGTFGYMFFIYMIRCLGITAAYGFLALVVLYFIPFAPKATGNTWSYARNRLKYGRLKSVALLLKNYYRLGQILIDKVAIGNGMTGKYHFKFEAPTWATGKEALLSSMNMAKRSISSCLTPNTNG